MRRHIALIFAFLATKAIVASDIENADTLTHTLSELNVFSTPAPKEAVSTTPIRITDQKQMLRTGVGDVSDALTRMPGVNLRDYGGAGGLKTVSVRGFGAGHTGVIFDGAPLSDVQSGQIDLSRYSIDNVKNVSMVIGDNEDIFIPARLAASAATVSISTMPVINKTDLSVKMRVGSFGFYNPFLRFGTSLSEKTAFNIIGEFTHADNDYPFKLRNGEFTTNEKRTNSRMNSGNAEANFIWKINSDNTLSAKAYYYYSNRQLPGPVIYYNNVSKERLHESNAMAQAHWRSRLSDVFMLNGLLKFNHAVSKYHDENGKYPDGILDQNYWQREYYTSWALLYTPTYNWNFDYSVDYFYNNLNSNLTTDSKPFRNSVLQSATAKFRTQSLTVMARLLYSLYLNDAKNGESAKNARRLSPSVSLAYRPISSQLLYLRASYKNIFRMPTFNEAYFDHYGSLDILPESIDQLNIGATYTISGNQLLNATFTLDGYVNNIHDMIVAVPFNMFVWSMVNLGKVRTYGIDAAAEVTMSAGKKHDISLNFNYSFQRAMPLTNPESSEWKKQVAYIPKHSGSAAVSYENPWVNISVSGTGVSERFTTNNNLLATRIDGYMEFGVTAWRSIPIKKHTIDLRFDIQNIFNKQYYIVARYPMPGRQFKFSFAFNY
ncbi:MAG: TonB-dependent receptor [Muribaculaceae bacterium]|nr:TonB-dependent receptor [Muribaculaceae bacterium]